MAEIRLVNKAKWILISQLSMSEPESHRYIEKQAMDRCVTRRSIAEESSEPILKLYFLKIISSRPGPLETMVMGVSISFSINSIYLRQFSGSSS